MDLLIIQVYFHIISKEFVLATFNKVKLLEDKRLE